jgi:hypothetical protein
MTRPLSIILQAAGLKTTRTLFDVLPHIDVVGNSAKSLRDGDAA